MREEERRKVREKGEGERESGVWRDIMKGGEKRDGENRERKNDD